MNPIETRKAIDELADQLDTSEMFDPGDLSDNPAQAATPLLVEMALQLHDSFEFVYDIWELDIYGQTWTTGALKDTALADKTDDSKWQILHAQIQCSLLNYGDGEIAMDRYSAAIAQDTSSAGLATDSIVSALCDDPQRAITSYWSAAAHAQNNSARQVVAGLPALFYALSIIKTKNAESAAETIEAFLMAYRDSYPEDRFVPVVEILFDFVSIRSGEYSTEELGWLNDNYKFTCPWQVLLRCACFHWLQLRPTPNLLEHLKVFASKAAIGEVLWYVAQARSLLACYIPALEDYEESNWLRDFLQPANDWQMQLQRVESISAQYTGGLAGRAVNNSSQRLAWWCYQDEESLEVTPRLQKKAKKGGWSKGRKLNFDDLFESYQRLDYLSPEDRIFCETLQSNQSHAFPYMYHRANIAIQNHQQLEAMTNLPLLFRADEHEIKPVIPMKLELLEPRLEILQQSDDDAITIQIVPFPHDARNNPGQWQLNWPTRDKLQVGCFTQGQLAVAEALGTRGLQIPAESKDRALDALKMLAPMITVLSDIGGADMPDVLEVEPDSMPYLELSPLQEGLRAELKLYPFGSSGPSVVPGEGRSTMLATIDNETHKTTRDIELEHQRIGNLLEGLALNDLADHDDDDDFSWDITDFAQSLELLDALKSFKDEVIINWPSGQKITMPVRVQSSQMSIKVGGDKNWLQLDGELQISEDRVLQMDSLLRLIESTRGRFIQLDDGSILALSTRLKSQLTSLRSVSDEGVVHPLASAVIDDATADMNVTGSAEWRKRLQRLQQAASLEPEVPEALNATLRDYQQDGYQWLIRLAHWGAGACLADDMGLGKTLQALAVALQRASLGPTLVVAPTSVCNNWIDEIERFAKSINVLRLGEGDRPKMIKQCSANDILICSYGLLQNEIDAISNIHWSTIIADEAQAFKNSNTRRSKAMMLLKSDFKMITTGTPIENHLGELWNLFRFINPGLLGSRKRFNERFAQPIEVGRNEQARLQLKALVRPFMLRRLKRDVLTELPPRTEITQLVEFKPQEAAFYEALRRQSMERISTAGVDTDQRFRILAEITRLRQLCCSPHLVVDNPPVESAKLRAFAAIVDELRENQHRCLVFSQFVGHLSLIREYLDKNNISYQYLDGSTPVKKRKQAVDKFQAGEGELFLISLKAGGSGLNLTAADYVIHMDPWWNPAVEDQASDRVHRMGQTRPVTIYRLVVKDTIEEKIVALHREKRDLADGLLEGSDSGVRLTVDDLMQLLNDG